jgi:hypothetical protein
MVVEAVGAAAAAALVRDSGQVSFFGLAGHGVVVVAGACWEGVCARVGMGADGRISPSLASGRPAGPVCLPSTHALTFKPLKNKTHPAGAPMPSAGPPASVDELRARLQSKLAALRAGRGAPADGEGGGSGSGGRDGAAKAKAWRERMLGRAGAAAARGQKGQAHVKGGGGGVKAAAAPAAQQQPPQPAEAGNGSLQFSRVAIAADPGAGGAAAANGRAGKKPSKAALLATAEARAAAAAGDAGAASDAAWDAALRRAAGEKVLDDPVRLRRSLAKAAKAKAKRAAAWADRTAAVAESMKERQAGRSANLAARAADKAAHKKARREKKLARPGFEGRRPAGFAG